MFNAINLSLAVSVKMNVLLFAPALFIILVLSVGLASTIGLIILCATIQVCLIRESPSSRIYKCSILKFSSYWVHRF